MTKNFSFLFFLITILSFAQIKFEKAYIINNDSSRSECFIKNIQWNTYPTEIEYKTNEDAPVKILKIDNIKEFGIGNDIYKRFEIQVDKSSTDLNDLSQKSTPEFITEKVFLKLLVDGNPQLYKYSGKQFVKFFYKRENEELPIQLIYKKYYDVDNDQNKSNNQFRNQITEITGKNVGLIDYKENQIVKLFAEKNNTKKISDQKDYFHFTVRPGVNFSKMTTQTYIKNVEMGNKTSFRIGFEGEYNFSFNKNKWAAIIEPEYSYYKAEVNDQYLSNPVKTDVLTADYSYLKVPIGFRHYMLINSKNRIFLNLLYSVNIPLKVDIKYENRTDIIDSSNKNVGKANNIIYGAGYSYNNKYFLETRYQTMKLLWPGKQFNTVSFILGYRFL